MFSVYHPGTVTMYLQTIAGGLIDTVQFACVNVKFLPSERATEISAAAISWTSLIGFFNESYNCMLRVAHWPTVAAVIPGPVTYKTHNQYQVSGLRCVDFVVSVCHYNALKVRS